LDQMISIGIDGLSIEEKVDPIEAVKLVDRRVALIGNIGVIDPLLRGTPGSIKEHTQIVCEACFNVVGPGCDLAVWVGKEGLVTLVKTVCGG
jgi:uroporphyrinogen-III decarboxylase